MPRASARCPLYAGRVSEWQRKLRFGRGRRRSALLCLEPAFDDPHDVPLFIDRKRPAPLQPVPFGQAAAAAGAGSVLREEDWMAAHRCLLAVLVGNRRSEPRLDQLGRVAEYGVHPPAAQVGELIARKAEAAAKTRPREPREDLLDLFVVSIH